MNVLKRISNFKGDEEKPLIVKRRSDRLDGYYKRVGGGKPIATYIVEGVHDNEIHVVKNNRLIEIYDAETREFITVIYATDGRLRQYFKKFPSHLFKKWDAKVNK